ncbi:MAG: sigma-54-dependent transcriptional regulator [Lentisphaeria bacterium]
MKKILVVDDNLGQRELFKNFLCKQNFIVETAEDGSSALEYLEKEEIHMVVSDIRMPGINGLELLAIMAKRFPEIPILLITAHAEVKEAINAVRQGAADYLEKPVDLEQLLECVNGHLKVESKVKNEVLIPPLPETVVAKSAGMMRVLHEVALVASTNASVMITGESGSGKEIVADLIYRWSLRKNNPIVKVNCAALSESLLESELFGHEKGAFTGALQQKIGLFEQADGGTIFLDEIGETSANLQAKLLRITQDGTFSRVGSTKEQQVNVRIIAATNRNLEDEIEKGTFREDLYYRLNVMEIYLPPLRDRVEDIFPLAQFFGQKFSIDKIRFSTQAQNCLINYRWPGNVRELRNAIERATLLARGDVILPEHLPTKLAKVSDNQIINESSTMASIERDAILKALIANNYNRSETAKALGISRRSLIYKLQDYQLQGYKINK